MDLTVMTLQSAVSSPSMAQDISLKLNEVWQQFGEAVAQVESMQQGYVDVGALFWKISEIVFRIDFQSERCGTTRRIV